MSPKRHVIEMVLAGIRTRTGERIHAESAIPSESGNTLLVEPYRCVKLYPPSRLKQFHTEAHALQRLAGLPFIPEYIDSNIEPNQYGWILQGRLQGKAISLSPSNFSDDESHELVCQAADWLRMLHQVPKTDKDVVFQHSSQQQRLKWIIDNLVRIPQRDLNRARVAVQLLEQLIASEQSIGQLGFVHRDFSIRNMLFKRTNNGELVLSGVVDFEHCRIGNIVSDLAMFIMQDLFDAPWLQNLLIRRYLPDGNDDSYAIEHLKSILDSELLLNALVAMTWADTVAQGYYRRAVLVLNDRLKKFGIQ